MNLIQCYVPTNDHDDKDKDQFYNRLQTILDKLKDKDINILMGDFNAKVGSDNRSYKEVMGQHALGEMNENGERFADLCGLNDLVIGGSIFTHKRMHKTTWVSPDHVTKNQIDHFCITKKFRRSLIDVRVRRGADAASDHHLLTARLKLKLKRMDRQAAGRAKYNINLLKDQTIQGAFTVTLRNRFQVLQELITTDTDAHDLWKGTKEALTKTSQEVLRPKKNQHKDWISVDTLQKIQARRLKKEAVNERCTRASKAAAQAEHTEAHKEVKRSVKKDKRDYIDSLAQEADEAAYHGNMKDLYMTTKKLAGKYSRPEWPVKDKQGQNITDSEQHCYY